MLPNLQMGLEGGVNRCLPSTWSQTEGKEARDRDAVQATKNSSYASRVPKRAPAAMEWVQSVSPAHRRKCITETQWLAQLHHILERILTSAHTHRHALHTHNGLCTT